MIIWRGKGILIALIAFGCLYGSEYLTRAWSGNERYYQTHGWPILVGFLIAAALVYLMRLWLAAEHTQEASLFFVPARFWPGVLAGLGVVFGASAALGLVQ